MNNNNKTKTICCIVSSSKQLFSNSIAKQSLYKSVSLYNMGFLFSFVCVNVHILEMEITILLLLNVPTHASNLYGQSYSSWPQIHVYAYIFMPGLRLGQPHTALGWQLGIL